MATLATETWTGTTGAAWPAQWTTFSTGTGGTATIQANAGRLTSPVGSASYPSESAYLSGMTAATDTDLVVSFRGTVSAVEQYIVVAIDVQSTAVLASNNWMPSTGYALLLSYGPTATASAIDLFKPASNGFNSLQASSVTLTGTTQYTLRFQRIGSAVRARIWATGSAEPSTWNINYTDAAPLAAGKVRLTAVSGSAAVARSFDFDDLTVTDGVATLTAPTVNAGADATAYNGQSFSRTATESDGGATITARSWTIVSGPTGTGTTIGTAAALTWTPTVNGTYTLRYSATNSVGTGTDDAIITVSTAPQPLDAWQAALTAKNASLLMIGTSLTEGQGSSARTSRWVEKIQAPIRSSAAVSGGGVGYLPSWYNTWAPSTFTPYSATTGTHARSNVTDLSLGRRVDNMSAAATVTYTVTGTHADLWWVQGYGSFTYSIDGAAATTVNTAGTAGTPMTTRITLGASASHTIKITATTAVRFSGVMVYDGDTTSGVRFFEAGHSTYEASNYTGMGAVWSAVAPDCALVELGANEYLNNTATSATTKTRIQQVISDLRAAITGKSFSVMLVVAGSWLEGKTTAGNAESWATYQNAIRAIATADPTIGVIELPALTSGQLDPDGLHANDTGQTAEANAVTTALSLPATGPVTVASALSGSGALSVTASPTVPLSAAPTGTGTLSVTSTSTRSVPVTLPGSGSLSATATPAGILSVAVSLAGAGALTAANAPKLTLSTPVSGSGALSITTATAGTVTASVALSGSGALTAAATPKLPSSAALSGSGALSATTATAGKVTATVALSGTGALTVATVPTRAIAASLTGTGSMSASYRVMLAVSLGGSGALAASPSPGARFTSVGLTGTGSLLAAVSVAGGTMQVTVWAATAPIFVGQGAGVARAFNSGDIVPDSHVAGLRVHFSDRIKARVITVPR